MIMTIMIIEERDQGATSHSGWKEGMSEQKINNPDDDDADIDGGDGC